MVAPVGFTFVWSHLTSLLWSHKSDFSALAPLTCSISLSRSALFTCTCTYVDAFHGKKVETGIHDRMEFIQQQRLCGRQNSESAAWSSPGSCCKLKTVSSSIC